MKLSEIYLLFLPTMFFGVISILLYFSSLKKQKEIIIFYENKITICKQKKQYDIKWEDVQQSSLEYLFFGTDSLIMELLTALILKPFYIQIKLKFNSNIELNEIKFCLPKRYIKYVQEKVKLSAACNKSI